MNARHLGPVKRDIFKACKQGILRLANMQKSGISALFRNRIRSSCYRIPFDDWCQKDGLSWKCHHFNWHYRLPEARDWLPISISTRASCKEECAVRGISGLFQFLLEVFLFIYSNGSAHLKLWGAFEARTTNCYSHGLVVWIVPNCIKAYVLYRKNLPIALLAAACNLCENTDFTEGCTTVFFKGVKKETQLLFLVAPDAEGPLCKDSPIPKILRTAAPPSLG